MHVQEIKIETNNNIVTYKLKQLLLTKHMYIKEMETQTATETAHAVNIENVCTGR